MIVAEIQANSFYDQDAVRKILGLTSKTTNAACRAGLLRFSKRGGRMFFKGQWLIDWLDANEKSTGQGESPC